MRVFGGARPVAIVAVAAMVLVAGALVVMSVRRPTVPTFAPTPTALRDAGRALVGPVLYTVDATSPSNSFVFVGSAPGS